MGSGDRLLGTKRRGREADRLPHVPPRRTQGQAYFKAHESWKMNKTFRSRMFVRWDCGPVCEVGLWACLCGRTASLFMVGLRVCLCGRTAGLFVWKDCRPVCAVGLHALPCEGAL